MYENIIAGITSTCWAIMPQKMSEILSFLDAKINAQEIHVAKRNATQFTNVRGDVAVIPLYGVISQKMNLMSEFSGGTSTELFGRAFDEAVANPKYSNIVIDIDSPGGNVYGVTELANKIYEARGKKKITAVSNSLMASAAYWIGSAAHEIIITPGGEAGSVGVLAVHIDQSKAEENFGLKTTIIKAGKYKAEGNPHEPLSAEATENLQSSVNAYYDMFTSDVAKFRSATQGDVKANYGQGRVMNAKDAVASGIADRIGTLEHVLTQMKPQGRSKAKARAELDSFLM